MIRPTPQNGQRHQINRFPTDIAMQGQFRQTATLREPLQSTAQQTRLCRRDPRATPLATTNRFLSIEVHKPDSFLAEAYSVGRQGSLAFFKSSKSRKHQ